MFNDSSRGTQKFSAQMKTPDHSPVANQQLVRFRFQLLKFVNQPDGHGVSFYDTETCAARKKDKKESGKAYWSRKNKRG